jgi:hypothetical protein
MQHHLLIGTWLDSGASNFSHFLLSRLSLELSFFSMLWRSGLGGQFQLRHHVYGIADSAISPLSRGGHPGVLIRRSAYCLSVRFAFLFFRAWRCFAAMAGISTSASNCQDYFGVHNHIVASLLPLF